MSPQLSASSRLTGCLIFRRYMRLNARLSVPSSIAIMGGVLSSTWCSLSKAHGVKLRPSLGPLCTNGGADL